MTHLKRFTLFVILLLFPVWVQASEITTVAIYDGVVSISGNGFGTKATQLPKAYFSFDSGAVDAPLSESGMNDEYNLYTYKPGITGNAAYVLESAGGAGSHLDYDTGSGQTKALVTGWIKINITLAEDETDGYCQLKLMDFGNGAWSEDTTAAYVSYPWMGETSYDIYGWTQFCRDVLKHANTYSEYGPHDTSVLPTNNTWIRFEWLLEANSAVGVEDGTVIDRWIFPDQSFNEIPWQSTSVSTHEEGDAAWRYFTLKMDIENVLAYDAAVASIHLDDLYVETGGWWHVEIGNAPTWGAETNRFIQPIKTYSNTAVTADYNQGNLPSGTAYLWVIDENGIPSDQDDEADGYQGYPITLGGTPTYDTPTITGPADFSTTESSVEIEGPYTVDPELTVSTCTWTLGGNSGFCVALLGTYTGTVTGLEMGVNSIVFQITDSNGGIASDTVVVTRTAPVKTSKINGAAVLKGAIIHQ